MFRNRASKFIYFYWFNYSFTADKRTRFCWKFFNNLKGCILQKLYTYHKEYFYQKLPRSFHFVLEWFAPRWYRRCLWNFKARNGIAGFLRVRKTSQSWNGAEINRTRVVDPCAYFFSLYFVLKLKKYKWKTIVIPLKKWKITSTSKSKINKRKILFNRLEDWLFFLLLFCFLFVCIFFFWNRQYFKYYFLLNWRKFSKIKFISLAV